MEGRKDKFSVIGEIYAQYTEKNKETLIEIARNLLKQQKQDADLIGDATPSKKGKGAEK